jgi:hypothetical protein
VSDRHQGARPDHIAARVARALGDQGLVDKLVALPQSDLSSLLLEVVRRRSEGRSPAELLAQYRRGGAPLPSPTDARATAEVERLALAAADGFEALDLSPVAPVGLNVVLGGIDQMNTLAALRGLEVLADPTTVMALEVARRRRAGVEHEIRLCTASRMLRLQPFDNPAFTPHFALFALVSAGRDRAGQLFERVALGEHLRAHLGFLDRARAAGYRLNAVRAEVADATPVPPALEDGEGRERRLAEVEATLFPEWRRAFPNVTFTLDPGRTHAMTYYRGLCLHVTARDPQGQTQLIGDGGAVDWTQRLLSNARERLFVSGFGPELLVRCFCAPS